MLVVVIFFSGLFTEARCVYCITLENGDVNCYISNNPCRGNLPPNVICDPFVVGEKHPTTAMQEIHEHQGRMGGVANVPTLLKIPSRTATAKTSYTSR